MRRQQLKTHMKLWRFVGQNLFLHSSEFEKRKKKKKGQCPVGYWVRLHWGAYECIHYNCVQGTFSDQGWTKCRRKCTIKSTPQQRIPSRRCHQRCDKQFEYAPTCKLFSEKCQKHGEVDWAVGITHHILQESIVGLLTCAVRQQQRQTHANSCISTYRRFEFLQINLLPVVTPHIIALLTDLNIVILLHKLSNNATDVGKSVTMIPKGQSIPETTTNLTYTK